MRAWAALSSMLVIAGAWLLLPDRASAQDIAILNISSARSGCARSNEYVTLELFNYGPTLAPSTIFTATYSLDGGDPVQTDVLAGGTIAPNTRFGFTFSEAADLSAPGVHTISATVGLSGDTSPLNDGFTVDLTNDAASVGGTIEGAPPTFVCSGDPSGELTLSGHTGSVERWERSEDDGLTWVAIANTSTTFAFEVPSVTTSYRARVVNGVCAAAYSAVATVFVGPTPHVGIASSTVVCPGASGLSAIAISDDATGFAWSVRGATIEGSTTDDAIAWTAPASGSATLSVEASHADACPSVAEVHVLVDPRACVGGDAGVPPGTEVRVEVEPAGEHCVSGGLAITTWQDEDRDGQLQPGEASTTNYVCDGAAGRSGGCAAAPYRGGGSGLGIVGAIVLLAFVRRGRRSFVRGRAGRAMRSRSTSTSCG